MEALEPGSLLLRRELTGPITLALTIVVLAAGVGGFLYYRGKPGKRGRARLSLVIAATGLAALIGVPVVLVQPGQQYGIVVEDGRAVVTYYGAERVEVDLCSANTTLAPVDRALDMLAVRTNGLADPVTGIYMGHYRARNGTEALVIVDAKSARHALVLKSGGKIIIVAVPSVEQAYKAIRDYIQAHCPH